MDDPNLFLENTLLLMAVLLFLSVLPYALRQKKKTELDRAVEKFEKAELKAAAEKKANEKNTKHKKRISPKDQSLAYLVDDLPTAKKTEEFEGIPPFPPQEEDNEKKPKFVKDGVPISHSELEDSLPGSKKKDILIEQEFSIAPEATRKSSKSAPPEPQKEKKGVATDKDQESPSGEDLGVSPVSEYEREEPDDNWIEAEIPGLTIEPLQTQEKPESIPTFKPTSKEEHSSETEKSPKSSQKEKPVKEAKNIPSKSEKKKGSKPKKQVEKKTDSLELEMEISEPEPKAVEIKAPVVSHKNIAKKEVEELKGEIPFLENLETQEAKPEGTELTSQKDDEKTADENTKPKPFLLDLKYLDTGELETENPVSNEKLSADMANAMIDRLNALQVDLENQLLSIPDELIPGGQSANGRLRKDQSQESFPDTEGAINGSSDKTEVSLNTLDEFLFTASQRKDRE